MRAGDVFRFPEIAEKHVWMIISDPARDPAKVLMVNFTSHAPHLDQACLVNPGEHPFITTQTLINYARAKLVANAAADALKASGRLDVLAPLSVELLQKIRTGAMQSITLPLEFADILVAQELVE